jgi:hypothetical protein
MRALADSRDDTAAFECRDVVSSPCPGTPPTHSWSEHALRGGVRHQSDRESVHRLWPHPGKGEHPVSEPLTAPPRDGDRGGCSSVRLDRLGLGRQLERHQGLHALLRDRPLRRPTAPAAGSALTRAIRMPAPCPLVTGHPRPQRMTSGVIGAPAEIVPWRAVQQSTGFRFRPEPRSAGRFRRDERIICRASVGLVIGYRRARRFSAYPPGAPGAPCRTPRQPAARHCAAGSGLHERKRRALAILGPMGQSSHTNSREPLGESNRRYRSRQIPNHEDGFLA